MPENVNFAESSTISPSMADSVSSGSFAAPFAEKLPTTPPVATLPVMRSTRSAARRCSAASMFRFCTARGRADPAEGAVLDRQRADACRARLPLLAGRTASRPLPSKVTGTPKALPRRTASWKSPSELRAEVAVETGVPLARRAQPAGADAHEQILQRHVVAAQLRVERR